MLLLKKIAWLIKICIQFPHKNYILFVKPINFTKYWGGKPHGQNNKKIINGERKGSALFRMRIIYNICDGNDAGKSALLRNSTCF